MSEIEYRKVKPLLRQLEDVGNKDSTTKIKLLNKGVMRANNSNDINALMITGKKKVKKKLKLKREQQMSGVDPDTIDIDDKEIPSENSGVEIDLKRDDYDRGKKPDAELEPLENKPSKKSNKRKKKSQGFEDIEIEYSRGKGTSKTFEIRDKYESEGTFEISDKGHVLKEHKKKYPMGGSTESEYTDTSRSTKKYKAPKLETFKRRTKRKIVEGVKELPKKAVKGAKVLAHEADYALSSAYGYGNPKKPSSLQRGVRSAGKSYSRSERSYKAFQTDISGLRSPAAYSTKLGLAVGNQSRRVRRKRKYVDIMESGDGYDMSGIS